MKSQRKTIVIDSSLKISLGAKRQICKLVEELLVNENVQVILVLGNGQKIFEWNHENLKIVYLPNFPGVSLANSLFFFPFWHIFVQFEHVYHPWGFGLSWGCHKATLGLHHPNFLLGKFWRLSVRSMVQRILMLVSAKYATRIRVPSKSFYDFIADRYKFLAPKLHPIVHAIDKEKWYEVLDRINLDNRSGFVSKSFDGAMFITWSAFYPETKNLMCLIKGFGHFKQHCSEDVRLVLAGSFPNKKYKKQIFNLIESMGLSESVVFKCSPSFDELVRLIAQSDGIILAFKHETFGYPYVEARIFDKPISIGLNSVALEVSEGQCYYFDSDSELGVSRGFKNLINNKGVRFTYEIGDRFSDCDSEMKSLCRFIFSDICHS